MTSSSWFSRFTIKRITHSNKWNFLLLSALWCIPWTHSHSIIDIVDRQIVSDKSWFRLIQDFLFQNFFVAEILMMNIAHINALKIPYIYVRICKGWILLVRTVFSWCSQIKMIVLIRIHDIFIRVWTRKQIAFRFIECSCHFKFLDWFFIFWLKI